MMRLIIAKRRRTVGLNWQYDEMMNTLHSVPSKRKNPKPIQQRKAPKSPLIEKESGCTDQSHAYTRFTESVGSNNLVPAASLRVASPDIIFEARTTSNFVFVLTKV
jgi:hypothetical protein